MQIILLWVSILQLTTTPLQFNEVNEREEVVSLEDLLLTIIKALVILELLAKLILAIIQM